MNSTEPRFSLAAVFGDHMVLQREKPLVFWGRGRPGDTVRLDWQTDKGSIAVETRVETDGRWKQCLAFSSRFDTRAVFLSGWTCDATGTKPLIDRTLPMTDARDGFAAMNDGEVFGKIVFTR
jgi:hypothetical protein